MYTVVGSGFGLYGYLPALAASGERVVLPKAYEAKVRARSELHSCLGSVDWVDDAEAALDLADAVVIATPPKRQVDLAEACAARRGIERLVLEKPVAPSPAAAARLLADLDRAGKRYRVGYTLLHTRWYEGLAWPANDAASSVVELQWRFMAHHFAHGLSNWKRFHDEGGGVLRFFGVHVVAMLAARGYDHVSTSSIAGADERAPERWSAAFHGAGLPECRADVDSRSSERRFQIDRVRDGVATPMVALADPFEEERPEGGKDSRVAVLERLLATFALPDAPLEDFYARVNRLWQKVEQA